VAPRAIVVRAIAEVAADPYAFGTPLGGTADRRQAVLADAVTVYWVSRGVLTVSVVTVIHADQQEGRPLFPLRRVREVRPSAALRRFVLHQTGVSIRYRVHAGRVEVRIVRLIGHP
jgi:hypothetical protein